MCPLQSNPPHSAPLTQQCRSYHRGGPSTSRERHLHRREQAADGEVEHAAGNDMRPERSGPFNERRGFVHGTAPANARRPSSDDLEVAFEANDATGRWLAQNDQDGVDAEGILRLDLNAQMRLTEHDDAWRWGRT